MEIPLSAAVEAVKCIDKEIIQIYIFFQNIKKLFKNTFEIYYLKIHQRSKNL